MSLQPGPTTLAQVRALTAAPDFIDVHGMNTGTIGATYNPTFVGERGWMLYGDAQPLDIGVPVTGDQLGICWDHTPLELRTAEAAATPFAVAMAVEKEVTIVEKPKKTRTRRFKPHDK